MNRPSKKLYGLLLHKFTSFRKNRTYSRQGNNSKPGCEPGVANTTALDTASKITSHVAQADSFLRIGEYDKAIDHYHQAINLAPQDKILQRELEKCHAMKKHFKLAVRSFWKGIQENPKHHPEVDQSRPLTVAARKPARNNWYDKHLIFTLPAAITIALVALVPEFTSRGRPIVPTHGIARNKPQKPIVVATNKGVGIAANPSSESLSKNPRSARKDIGVKAKNRHSKHNNTTEYAHVHPTDTIKFE